MLSLKNKRIEIIKTVQSCSEWASECVGGLFGRYCLHVVHCLSMEVRAVAGRNGWGMADSVTDIMESTSGTATDIMKSTCLTQ